MLDSYVHPEKLESIDENIELNYGDSERSIEIWQPATVDASDNVMCERYIANEALGINETEENICDYLKINGCFDYEFGCVQENIGIYLESLGLEVQTFYDLTMSDICVALENDEYVVCCVSNAVLYYPELSDMYSIMPNSYVEVIGVCENGPFGDRVIVNDPFDIRGGRRYALEAFMSAWKKSNCFGMIVKKSGIEV